MKNKFSFCVLNLLASTLLATAADDELAKGFQSPPDSAKPQTWWHWMNGNITKEGITADLEAMKQIGLGGATIVNVDCGIPRGSVPFMSPAWRDDFKFTIAEANRLGFELTVENCAGWSNSGGPWNTPEHGMQQVVSSELSLTGPKNFTGSLPQPPTKLDFYRDIAVLAYPVADADSLSMKDCSPVASASSDSAAAGKILDGDDQTFIKLPAPKPGKPQFVQLQFAKPFAARTVKIVGGPSMPECSGTVLVSDDGRAFRELQKFSFGRRSSGLCVVALGSEPVTARYWKIQFTGMGGRAKAAAIPVAEISLESYLSVNNLGKKTAMEIGAGVGRAEALSDRDADFNPAGALPRRNIIDLTSKLTADGKLNWQVPAGKWMVLRFGYTPTGVNNHPAPEEGTGLECDKFSQAALDAHWAGFMQKVLDDIKPLGGRGLAGSLIDSYEVGGQTWTKNFREEFQKRRGYDLLTYLPAFAGRVVDNPAVTERFLWDLRRTIADLFAENYFGHFAELCHSNGLISAVEPYTGPFESIQSGSSADFVMGEFWSGSTGHPSIKLASSIAHIYGRTFVGAESFTAGPSAKSGRWQEDPYSLKALGDLMYCQGLNRYVFHRYAMQPWTNRWPGMTMGQWGFHFERTETWWHPGKAWIDYISHCQFLLQQGRFVADAAYFTGESAPVQMRLGEPQLPAGYDFDAINADVLLHGATVKNGRLTLASGANYAALILPAADPDMTPALLRRIAELVHDGATVVGAPPQQSPSLAGFPGGDAEVKKLAAEMWGKCDGKNVLENSYGQGRVVWGKPMTEVFAAQKLPPDFEFAGADAESKLACGHRVAGEADIYFVSNQRAQFDAADCTFRVSGKVPELWHPDTGLIEPAPVWREENGRITVPLKFDPAGSVFVVFRKPASGADHIVSAKFSAAAKSGAPSAELKIRRASYEAVDGGKGKDVTAKLQGLVQAGVLKVEVSNQTFGGDPAAMKHKQLRVEYVLNGLVAEKIAPEKSVLEISSSASAPISEPPALELVSDAGGQVQLCASSPGVAELKTASGKSLKIEAKDVPAPLNVAGPWELNFPPHWGAPASVSLPQLISWPEHADKGVKYFSGTATYVKEVEIPAAMLGNGKLLWLNLGTVKNLAEVFVNGKPLGILWKPPFRADITGAVHLGKNKLEIKVTNLWPNRLIGDEQLPEDREWLPDLKLKAWPQWLLDGKPSPTGRLTFTTWHHWKKDDALLPSGLLGPVTLQTAETILVQ